MRTIHASTIVCDIWVLGPKNRFTAIWAQKLYQDISQEPWLQFSQTASFSPES